jgi:hypothetical protein
VDCDACRRCVAGGDEAAFGGVYEEAGERVSPAGTARFERE